MHRTLVALAVPVLCACGAAQPAAPPRAPAPIPAVQPAPARVEAPPPRAERVNRCLPNGPPKPRAVKKVQAADTCVDHRKVEAVLSRKLAKKHSPTVTGSSVDVSFGCDPLTLGVEEVVIETGYGHGGGLALHRFRLTGDEDSVELLTLALPGQFSRSSAPLIGRGPVDAKAFAMAFDTAHAALTAVVRELEPPPKPNAIGGRSFGVSSSNYHHYFRSSDGMHQLVRHFTGYAGTSGQSQTLGLREAMEAVRPLLDSLKLEAREPSADEREFFVESFLAASSRFEDEFAWWVRDRYVTMAASLGTKELVPALARVVESGIAEAEKETEPSSRREMLARRLEGPLATLAGLTGWDPRTDENGATRELDVVAREVIQECKPVATAR